MKYLWDFAETSASDLRDEAVARVEDHACPDWFGRALDALRRCCQARESFIVDEVWEFMADGDRPHEARAMGAVILQGVKRSWCRATEAHRASRQPHCHANPRRVWASLVFGRE